MILVLTCYFERRRKAQIRVQKQKVVGSLRGMGSIHLPAKTVVLILSRFWMAFANDSGNGDHGVTAS